MNYCFPLRLSSVGSAWLRGVLGALCAGVLVGNVPAQAANLPPKVAVVQPANDAVFTNPSAIQILVEAADADGFVRTVQLLTDSGELGSVTPDPAVANPVNPFQWTWQDPPSGLHKLVARAIDNEGAETFSDSVVISVKRDATATAATLVIVKPGEGETFSSPAAVVSIQATAVDPLADIRHVEFFANGVFIGRSDHWTKDAVIPGKPREHFLNWKPLEGGQYALTAMASDSQGNPVVSNPVSITVAPQLPVVSIEATVPETSEPAPNVRVRPGVFTVKRSGPTTNALTVFLAYDGSATPNVDYQPLPLSVTIPAGAASAELLVAAVEDALEEGTETVSATLVEPPTDQLPDLVIDPQFYTAKVLIHDAGNSGPATLDIVTPKDGEVFKLGDPILVNAVAVDPGGYIARVEFYDFETLIGVSQIEFIRAPDPGTPITHAFQWQNAAPGEHALSARAVDSNGNKLSSKAVVIKVLADAAAAVLEITMPKDGELFAPDQPIKIAATAIDPNGYIARVEFYDFEVLLGVSQLAFFRAPDPGTPIYHFFDWQDPTAGEHALSARAIDSKGNPVVSRPVYVKVAPDPVLPIVEVSALDAEATEMSPLVDAIDPARFLISRQGSLSNELLVVYSLHGTAEPDKDYQRPERFVRIPAGQREATVEIVPISDDLQEGMETVSIRLEDPSPISSLPLPPAVYAVPGWAREAAAVIYDRNPPEKGAVELALPSNSEVYQQSQPLVLLAAASSPGADLNHVDFYAGDKVIGTSDVLHDNRVPGGLILHRFDWKEPLAGELVLTAHTRLSDGSELVSSPVHVTVRGVAPTPVVALLHPKSGEVFAKGQSIELAATARYPDGSVQKLEVLADDLVVASSTNSDLFAKLTDLAAGPHVLVARAVDNQGNQVQSTPVKILVLDGDGSGGAGGAGSGTAEVKQIARQASGNIQLELTGPTNGVCLLEASSDLVHWEAVPPVFMPDGKLLMEENPKNGPLCRFYRTRAK